MDKDQAAEPALDAEPSPQMIEAMAGLAEMISRRVKRMGRRVNDRPVAHAQLVAERSARDEAGWIPRDTINRRRQIKAQRRARQRGRG